MAPSGPDGGRQVTTGSSAERGYTLTSESATGTSSKGEPMGTANRRPSPLVRSILLLAALALAAAALLASGACVDEEDSCSCSCENQVCASSKDGHSGCVFNFVASLCSPSGCCNYCCDH